MICAGLVIILRSAWEICPEKSARASIIAVADYAWMINK